MCSYECVYDYITIQCVCALVFLAVLSSLKCSESLLAILKTITIRLLTREDEQCKNKIPILHVTLIKTV